MRPALTLITLTLLAFALMLTGCATTEKEKPPEVEYSALDGVKPVGLTCETGTGPVLKVAKSRLLLP